jgi:hypothetical protein
VMRSQSRNNSLNGKKGALARASVSASERQASAKRALSHTETEADTDSAVSKDTDAGASSDKVFWDNAKAFIGGKNPGALIGKWNRDYGKSEAAKAITAAQVERAVDPVSYIEKVLRKSKQDDWEYTGP